VSCLVCQSRAELYLCNPHLTDLRANLVALAVGPEVNCHPTPGLLDALADVVLKQTRLGTGGGHRKRGDELPAPFIPDEERLDKDGHVKLSRQGEASWHLRIRDWMDLDGNGNRWCVCGHKLRYHYADLADCAICEREFGDSECNGFRSRP